MALKIVPASADPRSSDLRWTEKGVNGRTAMLEFTQGGCVHATGASVTETATTVAVRVHATHATGVCPQYVVQVTATVELPHALGGRALVQG